MVVGYNITVFINDESRSKASLLKIMGSLVTEKTVKKIMKRIVLTKRTFFELTEDTAASFDCFYCPDVNYRRAGIFSQLVETFRV